MLGANDDGQTFAVKRFMFKKGDVFLLPAHVIHSPQRPEPDLCFLIEKPRPLGHEDASQWYCAQCATMVWRAQKQLESLVDEAVWLNP